MRDILILKIITLFSLIINIMCTRKYYGEERATGLLRLRLFMGKLQKRFSLLAAGREAVESDFDGEEILQVTSAVPDDVKEGYFAVLAADGAEKKRFVIELDYLKSPKFLRLLEQAEEEYGFEQTGALVVPCKPEELQKILETERR